MTRCAICGRKLTVIKSVVRGIGPVCWNKINGSSLEIKTNNGQKPNRCKVCGHEISYVPSFDALGLPCNSYCCYKGHCPFAHEKECPRERVYIKKDIYPLYQNKPKNCAFCGKLLNGGYIKRVSKTKITFECRECQEKNKSWRQNNIEGYKTMSLNNLDIFIKNKIRGLEK